MPKGIYAAASAMMTETRLLEVTARNIAHAQTPGFRREGGLRIGFAEVLGQTGDHAAIAGEGAGGVVPNGSYHVFDDGLRDPTGNPYDLALNGDGFFAVQDHAGKTWLTRNGNFQVDGQGRLMTREGHLVLGQGGPITIPAEADRVVVDPSGTVSIEKHQGQSVTTSVVDQLRIAQVADPRRMPPSNGIYFDPAGQSLKSGTASVHQGEIERGNVNAIDELVQMVSLQRRYDSAQRAITAQNQAGEGFSDVLR